MSTLSTGQHVLLKDIRPAIHKVDIEVITLQQEGEPVARRRDGATIRKFLVADPSGTMILSVLGTHGDYIQIGDVLRVTDVQSKVRSGQHILITSKLGKVKRLGQDTFPFVESPNFSEVTSHIPPSRLARVASAQAAQPVQKEPRPSTPTTSITSNQQQQGQYYAQSSRYPGNRRGGGNIWRGGEWDRYQGIGRGRQMPTPSAPPIMGATKPGEVTMNGRDPRKRYREQ
ncbi:hypothetical protein BC941DRAFT_418306 [Chlamydoabsidia padenii]|nr:hypothetical protein BC941DRAFT_418306 [Chlamydoabsidia padenii]